MAAFDNLTTDAAEKRRLANLKDREAQDKYEELSVKAGTGKGQTKDTKDTLRWFMRQVKDLLLIVYNGNEEALSPFGFNVVIRKTGSRKHVRVDIPKKHAAVVKLAQHIVEHHAALGAGSPLTATLVDMATLQTLAGDSATLLLQWEVLRGEVQALNGDAINTIGYGAGQKSTTVGTLYNELTKIRRRLLQHHQGREEALTNWGFNVKIHKFSQKRKSAEPVADDPEK
jgi:hypothetical protein